MYSIKPKILLIRIYIYVDKESAAKIRDEDLKHKLVVFVEEDDSVIIYGDQLRKVNSLVKDVPIVGRATKCTTGLPIRYAMIVLDKAAITGYEVVLEEKQYI